MYLGANRVCVTPRAKFLFHGTIPGFGYTKEQSDRYMTDYYPPKLRAWFYGTGIDKFLVVFKEVTLGKVMSLSDVGYCKEGGQ